MVQQEKKNLLSKQEEKYKTMERAKKELLQKRKQKFSRNKSKNVDSFIETFKKKMMEGPYLLHMLCAQ